MVKNSVLNVNLRIVEVVSDREVPKSFVIDNNKDLNWW